MQMTRTVVGSPRSIERLAGEPGIEEEEAELRGEGGGEERAGGEGRRDSREVAGQHGSA